jgi:Big-like domain-containing protein
LTAKPPVRIALVSVLTVIVLAFIPAAPAAPGGGAPGGGGKTSCTQKAPVVIVDNTWQWGAPGSWGMPGQTLTYAIDVLNYDVGCGSSTFAVNVAAPGGFSVSLPTNSIALKSSGSGYLKANVTSPSAIADGDYPLTVTVQRVGSPTSTASFDSYYRVYSSDSVAPNLYWASPGDGTTISGNSYNVSVSSDDDHAVQKIDLYIDNVYKSTTVCAGVSYRCQLYYTWSMRGAQGQHTATFRSFDWMGNVGVLTTTFTVG